MAIPRLRRYDPPPAEVLGPDVIARLERWKRVYRVMATYGIDCWRDAELLTNRFEFAKWRRDHQEAHS